MRHLKLFFILSTLILGGCARFQGNQVEIHEVPNQQRTELKKVTYEITGNVEAKDEKFLKDVMKSYGIDLVWGNQRKDGTPHLNIDFTFKRMGAANVAAVITGLSLYTIPSWQTQYYQLTAHLNYQDLEYSYRAKDHTTLVQWLPMIFAFPFAMPFTAENELTMKVYTDMAYNVSKELNLK